jgi:D-alanyl-D-alanine carboxypeptidase
VLPTVITTVEVLMQDGTVRIGGLNLRKSLKAGSVSKVLRKNSRVTILGTETWHRVRTRDGEEGYVFADFVEIDRAVESTRGIDGPPLAGNPLVITTYQNPRFTGQPATVDADFVPHLDRISGFAGECGLKIFVTSSLRDPDGGISNAIVTPAKRSNHFVGHAIDMNLQLDNGTFINSSALKKLSTQPQPVQRFIELVRNAAGLRWGGDFPTPDVVHIDDGLNITRPDLWDSKFASR